MRILRRWSAIAFVCFVSALRPAFAAPVTADIANSAVRGWLHQDHRPLGSRLSANIKSTKAVKNAAGETLYYVVHLDPTGFVILAADDATEPIVAFSAAGSFDASSGSTLTAMVNHDMPRRRARVRAASALKARHKWNAFLAGSPNPPPDAEENGNIVVASQIWVAPFVQTLWSQTTDASGQYAVYNYYTPPFATGNTNNDPCGCVATALAQEMYYFQYPNTGVGTGTFTITNNGANELISLFGGNGSGGAYQWANMPLSLSAPTPTQAMAIGNLTHDIGATVHMSYTPILSSAYNFLAQQAMTSTFKYANASYFEDDNNGLTGTNLVNMINPNLDARLPVILGVLQDGGHCLLCDGYGYSSSTLFHHLNMGYGGDDDIWYALPDIETTDNNGDFTLVASCIYNIYTNGSGQIISGRVTDPTGAPVAGATVDALAGINIYETTTDTNGIYALAGVAGNSAYTLSVNKSGDGAATGNYSAGAYVYNHPVSGNVWGANFVLSPQLLTIPETGFAAVGPVGGPFNVSGQIYTVTNKANAARNWTISNTNTWLITTPTNGTVAASNISTLTISLSPAATNLAAGTYSGSIWITNVTTGAAQQLMFSLSVETADYPIAVTGYNLDVVVENDAVGGSTINYADAFDPSYPYIAPTGPVCFYEAGLVATNLSGSGPAVLGLPPSGLFTNKLDGVTTFQFGPYDGSNVLCLTSSATSGSLTLNSQLAYKSLSVLAASAQGGGSGTLVIHFTDGTSSSNISFTAPNYLTTNTPGPSWAITNFGLLATGGFTEFYSLDNGGVIFPSLYQTPVNLHALGLDAKLISSVTFTMPGGAGTTASTATGIFALSGTQAPYTGNYTLAVIASPASGGTVSSGGAFPAGSTATVTALPHAGYIFANWTQGGAVVSTSPDYTFIVNSGGTLVANFAAPSYLITVSASPADGGTVIGSGVFPGGSLQTVTATTNPGFEFVAWSGDATGTISPLTVTVNGNLNITANFAPVGTNITVRVITNGYGTVTPTLNGKDLKANKSYTLTATAKSGTAVSNVFLNWTGSITTNKSTLTFKAVSNMVLQANFIPNPFLPVKGTYNGLFFNPTNGVAEQTAGMLKGLVVGTRGTYSGTLLINGAGHGFSGTFNLAGQATNKISRPASQGGNLILEMTLNGNTPPPQVTGTVTGSNVVASLTADRATNTVPSAEYTMLIPPDTNSMPPTISPGGDSYALVTNHVGTARIAGALADGTVFNQTVPVSQDGYVPIYANLYAGKGLLLGWINLDLTNTDAVGNTALTWIHPVRSSGLYTNGFTNVLLADQIQLSPWSNAPATRALLTNLSLLDTSNDTNTLANFVVTISNNFKLGKVSGSTPLSGTIDPKTGLLKVIVGSGAAKTNGYGAVLFNAPYGGGYFLTKTNAQAIKLSP